MAGKRVLVVDDEADVRALVGELLRRVGHDVSEAGSGQEGLRRLYDRRPDLVVLDVAMPDLDGWQTLARIRELSDVPVLMLTARGGELDKVRGLRGGADDYVTKPFGRQELLARVEALLRRSGGAEPPPERHVDPYLSVDFRQRRVTVGGRDVALTPLEFRLLTAFVRNPNQVLAHEQLIDLVWGESGGATRDQLKIYVGYLRRKLGEGVPIETVRGFGYRYGVPREAA